MKRPFRHIKLPASLILIILCGCTSLMETDSVRVIERSKKDSPAWVSQSVGRMTTSENSHSYIGMRTHLLNLPLGIKDTQLKALKASRDELVNIVRTHVERVAHQSSIAITSRNELTSRLLTSVTKVHEQFVNVVDIYYEKVAQTKASESLQEYFRVFVLVEFNRSRDAALYAAIRKNLSTSRQSDLRSLAAALAQHPDRPVSH